MQPFRIDKAELVEKVQANRDAHRGVYEQAMTGYRDAAAKFFNEQLERARKDKPFINYFAEPVPEDHTEDYDVVLDGWEMTNDDVIELSVNEFRQYVRDEWGWKKQFSETTANYLGNNGR